MHRYAARHQGSQPRHAALASAVAAVSVAAVAALAFGAVAGNSAAFHVGIVVVGLAIASMPLWYAARRVFGSRFLLRAGVLLVTLGLLAAATQDTYGLALLFGVPGLPVESLTFILRIQRLSIARSGCQHFVMSLRALFARAVLPMSDIPHAANDLAAAKGRRTTWRLNHWCSPSTTNRASAS